MVRKREKEKTDLGRTANLKEIIKCPLFHYLLTGMGDKGFSEEFRVDLCVTKISTPNKCKSFIAFAPFHCTISHCTIFLALLCIPLMWLPNCDGHLLNLVVIETTTLNQDTFFFLIKNTVPYIIFPEGAFLCRKFYKPTNGNISLSEQFNWSIQITLRVASLVKLKFRFGWEHNKHETDAEI